MINPPQKPGFWHSSLDEQAAVAASVEFSQPLLSQDGVPFWVTTFPERGGMNGLCRYQDDQVQCLTPDGFSVRSKVHEYGGQAWCFIGCGRVVFVNADDQQLYTQNIWPSVARPVLLTEVAGSRFIEPVYDALRNQLICVEEIHREQGVANRLVCVCLDSGCVKSLHEGYDFYAYPTLSDDSHQLAFIGWQHPAQPWLKTRCCLADLTATSDIERLRILRCSGEEVSLSQPCFTPDNRLFVVSDQSGFWQIHAVIADQISEAPLLATAADCINAPWQGGLRHFGVRADGQWISLALRHQSVELYLNQTRTSLEGFSQIRNLAVAGDRALLLVAGEDRLPAVIMLDETGQIRHLSGGERPLSDADCALPEAMCFRTDDHVCYGYFYPPANSRYAEHSAVPPLVIFLHGGPTAATYPVLNLKLQYWTQRGFAVLDLNYRGSSNYGRAYRLALAGRWGRAETDDIALAVKQLTDAGRINPDAIFIRGNSSGGFSALNALCDLNCFAGGASLYGVTDPLALGQVTHKFESHYLDWLIADPAVGQALYTAVSPLHKIEQISAPVIFFQGEQDRVVVPEQTRAMVRSLKASGHQVEAVYFADEGHGFRLLQNQIQVLQQELKFYQSLMD